jgi:ATP/maltotriose-dependent transcriptional regulator MalT
LTTKLHISPPRPNLVPRSRLIEQLNIGLYRQLTLLSKWIRRDGIIPLLLG